MRRFAKQNDGQDARVERTSARDPYARSDRPQEVAPVEVLEERNADPAESWEERPAGMDENAAEAPQEEFGGDGF